MSSSRKKLLAGLSGFLIFLGGAAFAVNASNTPATGYILCVNKTSKIVTYPGTLKCPTNSSTLILGAQGPAGADGATGLQGPMGPQGPAGAQGPAGLSTTVTQTSSQATPSSTPADNVCSPKMIDPLPYSNNHIALTALSWGYDGFGYPYALMTVRNDSGEGHDSLNVALTLSNGAVFEVTVFNHTSLTEVNPIPGGWIAGQSRTFKVVSTSIFNCSTAQISSSGWQWYFG